MEEEVLQFTLNGKKFSLTRGSVRDALRGVSPKMLDKYFVLVNELRYPPKQVLAKATGLELVSFTTMAANTILRRLGFPTYSAIADAPRSKTISEELFEEYLRAAGIPEFEYEPALGQARPDYWVPWSQNGLIFEVKQFEPNKEEDYKHGGGAYDPYEPIRRKIQEARKKFKEFKEYPCALVLFNVGKPLVRLRWEFVFGAMLGNMTIFTPFDKAGVLLPNKSVTGFGAGGEMHRHANGRPIEAQNTTISAVIVLDYFEVGRRRFDLSIFEKEKELLREMNISEFQAAINHARGTERDISLRVLRCIACENPYARLALPAELFAGPYDERYRSSNGTIARTFAGEQLKALEKEEDLAGFRGWGTTPFRSRTSAGG